jgi:glycosyltransferase involved in cell wall biosynthesis
MHIAQLLPELNEGGVERGTVDLNRELVLRGHRSSVISAGGRLEPQIKEDGGNPCTAPIASKNPLTFPMRYRELRRQLDEISPDIVHVRSRVPGWLAWHANKQSQRPFVTTVHGFNSVSRYSKIMTQGDRVICVSEAVRDYVAKHYDLDEERLRVIPRGIDLDYFDPDKVDESFVSSFRDRYNLHNSVVVTTIGRLTSLKDYETFLRAFALLRWEVDNVRGLIVGGTHLKKRRYARSLRTLATSLALDGIVHFVGSVPEIREVYSLSDVVVSASKKPESFGRTCAEALAMRRPVVATNHGGVPEIVKDRRHGFLIETGSPEALAEAVQMCRHVQCDGFRSHIAEKFSLEQMITNTLNVYEEVAR